MLPTKSKIALHISDPDNVPSTWTIDLADDFDTVFSKLYPVTPPSSSLEHRTNTVHTMTNGLRITLPQSNVYLLMEVEDAS